MQNTKKNKKYGILFWNGNVQSLFDNALKYIINILILYIILILGIGLARTLSSLQTLLGPESVGLQLSQRVSDILSYLVMIELFRGFIEYFKVRRLRLHSMIDPAIVFVVRELIIKLYEHDTATEASLIQFGVLLLCMGIIRTLAVCFSPAEEKP